MTAVSSPGGSLSDMIFHTAIKSGQLAKCVATSTLGHSPRIFWIGSRPGFLLAVFVVVVVVVVVFRDAACVCLESDDGAVRFELLFGPRSFA